jgi:hypothetical protein
MRPQLIADRYQVVRALGRGGMGTVWLCRDEVLGRQVAVKHIGEPHGESATGTKRAIREARSAAAFNHPNAVALYDVVTYDGQTWLVMEYVEGETLAQELARDGRLWPQRVADIGAQLASALARTHEARIVHRDIKPGNVLIDKLGHPKISDFGIARGHADEQLTRTGFITGTPGYLSPEVARGADATAASDVWALGATLYTAVEGQAPYESRGNPIALLQAIARERPRPMTHAGVLGPAISAMMDEDPARRWDMAMSAKRLGDIARGASTAAIPRCDLSEVKVVAEVVAAPVVKGTRRREAQPRVRSARSLQVRTHGEPAGLLEAGPATAAVALADHLEPFGLGDPDRGALVPPAGRGSAVRWLLPVALMAVVLGIGYPLSHLEERGASNPRPDTASRTTPATTSATDAPTSPEPSRTIRREHPARSAAPKPSTVAAPPITQTPTPAPAETATPTAVPAPTRTPPSPTTGFTPPDEALDFSNEPVSGALAITNLVVTAKGTTGTVSLTAKNISTQTVDLLPDVEVHEGTDIWALWSNDTRGVQQADPCYNFRPNESERITVVGGEIGQETGPQVFPVDWTSAVVGNSPQC